MGPKQQDLFEVRPHRRLLHHFQVTIESSRGGSMRFRIAILTGILLVFTAVAGAAGEAPLLAHSPPVSKTQEGFSCGGRLSRGPPRRRGFGSQKTTPESHPPLLHV